MIRLDKGDESPAQGQRNNSGLGTALDMGVGILDEIPDLPGQV